MDTKSGYPWWTVSNGLIGDFPPLRSDARCEVAVIGAGITGSLIAHALVESGLEVMVLDRREAGWGSTAASTALLQYEIDTPLVDLLKRYGESAARAYLACDEAIDELAALCASLGVSVGFRPCGSLYFASKPRHAAALKREYRARHRYGLPVESLDRDAVRERFGIDAPWALWTPHAGRLDPYRFARTMLHRLCERGARVHDISEVQDWQAEPAGLRLRLTNGAQVRCDHLVVAGGYETQRWVKQDVATNHSSYVLVTEPMEHLPLQLADNLIWETARPYVYLRATDDGRIIVGGEDDRHDLPARRDALLPRKVDKLMDRLRALAPACEAMVAFSWAGTFAETRDGLPCIGQAPGHDPRVQFVMAYGGNGITYSTIAASMVRDTIRGRHHPLDPLFGFARLAT